MRIIPFAIIVPFDRFSRLRHAKSHEGISAQKVINARKIPGVSDTGPKEGRVPFSHVCTPRVRNSTSFSLQGSPLFLLLLLLLLLWPVISSPIRSAHSPADARDYSWPLPLSPPVAVDVTPHDVCIAWRHEHVPRKPSWRRRARGQEVISLFSFFVALFILESRPPKFSMIPGGRGIDVKFADAT